MKPGLEFENSSMKFVCLAFYTLSKRDVGLFQRDSDEITSTRDGQWLFFMLEVAS